MKSLLLTTLIIFSDQLSKFLIKSYLLKYQSIEIIGNFLKFTYIENKGIAFGIENYIRICYSIDNDVLKQVVTNLIKCINDLRLNRLIKLYNI